MKQIIIYWVLPSLFLMGDWAGAEESDAVVSEEDRIQFVQQEKEKEEIATVLKKFAHLNNEVQIQNFRLKLSFCRPH